MTSGLGSLWSDGRRGGRAGHFSFFSSLRWRLPTERDEEVVMPDEARRMEQGLLTIQSEPQDAHSVSLHGELDRANA